MDISVVVPVYNEEKTLEELFRRTSTTLEALGSDYEVVFVDDGSTDSSREIIRRLNKHNPRAKALFLQGNFGQHAALVAGIRHAQKDHIVTIDADLQNEPEDIAHLVEKMKEGYDAVKGRRRFRETKGLRRLYSFCANTVLKRLINKDVTDYGCALGIYRKELFDRIFVTGKIPRYIFYFVFRSGAEIAEIQVTDNKRKGSESRYGFLRLAMFFAELVMTFLIYSRKGYRFFKMSVWMSYLNILLSVLLLLGIVSGRTPPVIVGLSLALIVVLGLGQLLSHAMVRKHILEYEREFSREPLYRVEEVVGNLRDVS